MKRYFREPFNSISHGIASILSVIGTAVLVLQSAEDPAKQLSVALYGASLTLMFSASTAYHAVHGTPERIFRLRQIDHASIFVLIAGTYIPLSYNLFTGFWRFEVLILIWILAIAGILYKAFRISKSDWVIVSIYLAAGWVSVLALPAIMRFLPPGAIALLFGGGVLYTLGAVLSAMKKLDFRPDAFGHHEVWHLFVIAAAFCHYVMVLWYVVPVARIV
jgi:hemolysin III